MYDEFYEMDQTEEPKPKKEEQSASKSKKPEKLINELMKQAKPTRQTKKEPDPEDENETDELIMQINGYYDSDRFGLYLKNKFKCPQNLEKKSTKELQKILSKIDRVIALKNNSNLVLIGSQASANFYENIMVSTNTLNIKGFNNVLHQNDKYLDLLEEIRLKMKMKEPPIWVRLAQCWGMTSYALHNINNMTGGQIEPITSTDNIADE